MVVIVLFIMCLIAEISGGPAYHRAKRNNENELTAAFNNEIHHWPTTANTYLLPKIFELEDQITVNVGVTNETKRINVSLITHENETDDTSVCTFIANLDTESFSIFRDNEISVLNSDLQSYLNGSEFYVKFIRREGDDQERNILDIEGLSPVEAVKISTKNMDHIRYVRISGDNIKVRQLNFSFA